MRAEIVEMLGWGSHWQVCIRQPNGHHYYRMMDRRKYPDELSAFMAVTKELDQEEQTNGNHC